MENPNTPNFGELLAPCIGQVEPSAVPNFLAMLERGAAARYRQWAEQWPEHREGLLACSAREDEIADVIDQLHPITPQLREQVSEPLPEATDIYYGVFASMDIKTQLAVQADAELQGAAAWRNMIDDDTPEKLREGLEHCATLEETSSAYLREILGE